MSKLIEKSGSFWYECQRRTSVYFNGHWWGNDWETVEGIERYPISIRYPQDYRNSVSAMKLLPILTPSKQQIVLSDVADVSVNMGAPMLKQRTPDRLVGFILMHVIVIWFLLLMILIQQ